MSNLSRLIGLHGKPRVGKDTVATYLVNKYGFMRYGPSVRVKLTTAAMFDFPAEYLDRDDMKDQMDPFWGMTYRQMAQKVGKESSRDVFGDDIWMRHVEKQLQNLPNNVYGLVLPDVRYASEIKWIKEHGGDVFYIIRDNAPTTSDKGHVVDAGLPLELADVILYNNGTIDELHVRVENEFAFYYSWE